jgi:hypothetical protein
MPMKYTPLYQQPIYFEPPATDDTWMLDVRIAAVPAPATEPEIVVGMDELMGWSECNVEDWPLPVMN